MVDLPYSRERPPRRPLHFVASSRKDLQDLPGPVQDAFGKLLLDAQSGGTPYGAKPLKGFGSAGVLELIEDYDRSTYRAVYTVNFPNAVYVLHVFQKKAMRGIATPRQELEVIRWRYEQAERHYREHYGDPGPGR